MFRRSIVLVGLFLMSVLCLSGCGGSSQPITISIGGTGGLTVVDGSDTLTLTATLTNDSNSKGVTWSVSGGGTLSNQTATTAVYTAPATPASALTVTVTATSVADTSKSGTFTITVPAALTITTTSSQLVGKVGTAFSYQLTSTQGEGTLKWTVDSSTPLPTNWALSTSGLLTGPAPVNGFTGGTYKFIVTDSGTPTAMTANATLTVTITAAPAIAFGAAPAATATVGQAYSSAVAATGGVGTLQYKVLSGSLPTGSPAFAMTAAGAIAGTPTAAAVAGSPWTFTAEAYDAYGDTGTQQYSITVNYPALSVTNPGSLTAYNGTAYTTTTPLATLGATGGSSSYTGWSLTSQSGSSVPPGLSINSSGQIIGTPTANGTYNVTAKVTDSASETANANFAITVNAGITITPASSVLPEAYANSSYTSGSITASGGSGTGYKWTISSGSLPSWLSFSTTSGAATTLTGTPTSTASAVSFTVKVTDSVGNVQTAAYSVTVAAGVSVIVPSIPTFYPGDTTYAATTFTASGGAGAPYTYTWTAIGGTALPSGLSLTQSGTNAGLITGTPVNATSSSVTSQVIVTAKDSAGNTGASTAVSITIQRTITVTTPTPLPTGVLGTAYSTQLAASGGSNSFTWSTDSSGTTSLTGVGLTLNSNGTVTGTSGGVKAGSATFNATATDTSNSNHSGSLSMTVTINASLGISTSSISPTYAYGGSTYTSSSIAASGGTGSYTWSIASTSPTSLATLENYGLNLSSTSGSSITIMGSVTSSTVTTTTTLNITVQVKDSSTPTPATATATYQLTLYPQFTLVPSLTSVAESATLTAGQETVTAVGGSGSYSFVTVTPPTGMSYSVSGSTVSITGAAPSSAGSYPFTVTVKDTATGVTIGSANNYSLVVNAPGATVKGNISLSNNCGSFSTPTVTVTLYQGTTQIAQTTTTNGGSYGFSGVPAGNYTITPSYTGTGITSVFYPASLSITASGNTLANENFSASIGYTVTGTVNYTGGVAGQIYLNLINTNCSGNTGSNGTSLATTGTTSGGTFTIQGVPTGTYTLKTWEDPNYLGQGQQNAVDPVASDQSVAVDYAPVSVSSPVSLANPTYTTPTANPQFTVTQVPNGVLLFYQASQNSNSVEDADTYVVQWSTSSTLGGGSGGGQFATVAGSHTFKAIGPKSSTVWILTNAILTGSNQFQAGQSYFFQARSFNSADSNAHPSGWFTTSADTSIVNTAAPCSGTCTAVTSSITIPSGVTINSGAPLYEGFYQQIGNGAPTIYATVNTSPTTGSALSYSVSVPSGSGWVPFAILDQNLDGLIDAGNVTNIRNNNSSGYTVSGSSKTVTGVTLPGAGATASVATDYYSSTNNGGSSTGYTLNFDVRVANQLPVAVELESGPNVMYPIDLSNYCQDCGNERWDTSAQLNGVTPSVGDTYTFKVWYLGNSTPSTITGKVVGWNGGSTLTGAADLPTNLSPAVTAGTTPSFSWSVPSADSSATFQFWLNDNTTGNQIWTVPSNNSNSNGLSSSVTSLAWDVDPTDSTNTSSESTLNANNTYSWTVEATDSYNNQAQASTWFQP
ncbi:MAG: putative Ig domain-containing protein [Terracidiphilus sp.]|nr:putative Ig domain-containing protein [Terracidiphilus sp.]